MASPTDLLRAIHTDHRRIHGVVSCGELREEWRPDELQVLRWVDRYKRLCQRPFPTLGEILSIMLLLGYRKSGPDRLSAGQQDQEADLAEQCVFLERITGRARRAARQRQAPRTNHVDDAEADPVIAVRRS